MAEQAGSARTRSRGRAVGMDMIRSMGLVALVLLAILWVQLPDTPDPVKPVDWRPVATAAAATTGYPVLAPPASWAWTATSARVEPQPDGTVVWRAGFLTPSGEYAAVLQRGPFPEQAARARDEWIQAETRNGQLDGATEAGGRTWQRQVGDPTPDERRALVALSEGTATVVTGSASWSELEKLAAGLRQVR